MSNAILDNSMFLKISKSKAGNIRRADKDQITTDTDKERLTLGKKLFDCKEYEDIGTFDSRVDDWVKRRAIDVDTGFRGVYILPLGLLQDVNDYLTGKATERQALVEKFLAVYDEQREEGRRRLNGMFRESDYPPADVIRSKFALTWRYVEFGVSKKLPPDMLKKEQEALETQFKNMEVECRQALRQTCIDLCQHLSDTLTPAADGTRKRFFDSSVTNLVEFLDLFGKRDITNDEEMRTLTVKAKEIVALATPDRLRNSDDMRASVKEAMDKVVTKVSGMIESERRRKFDL